MSQSRRMLKNVVDLGYGYYFDIENDLTMYDVVCFIEEFLGRANIPRYEVVIYAEPDRTAWAEVIYPRFSWHHTQENKSDYQRTTGKNTGILSLMDLWL